MKLPTEGQKKDFNILMYSHDTYGLGHIRRTMAIARHLTGSGTNILILTGSPLTGRLAFPKRVDYVRMPGMIKKSNDEYFPLTIRIAPQHAMEIRQSIIMATVQTFKPDLFIVDKEPQGLKKEVLPALEWIRENLSRTQTVLGLRDIMDDARTVKENWEKKNVYDTIENLYSEVWIYGEQHVYDPVTQYEIPDTIKEKMVFTGYIPRAVPEKEVQDKLKRRFRANNGQPLITLTTGGGGDGFKVLDTYLDMVEKIRDRGEVPPFKTVMVTGPFLSGKGKSDLKKRAKELKIRSFEFFPEMESLIAASDLVVCMGGYNTLCEVLSSRTMALVIPRETPRKEQFIRAEAFKREGLLDFIPWSRLTLENLEENIHAMLNNSAAYVHAMAGFEMRGITSISHRISKFWNGKNGTE